MLYFAYGSNMNQDRMKKRGADFSCARKALLKDYQLKFNKVSTKNNDEGFANIITTDGSMVEGVLYQLDDESLLKLDKFENYPISYKREIVKVEIEDAILLEATTYIANSGHVSENLLPNSSYLSHLLAAKNYLSREYYEFLLNHPTL